MLPDDQRAEVNEQRRKVDFDSYDITVDELTRRIERKKIEVSPAYQRKFRWDLERQSRLIESLLLGIPVPPLFMATNVNDGISSTWEAVDGVQRILSLVNFTKPEKVRKPLGIDGDGLMLSNLEKLHSLNGCRFADVPGDIQDMLLDRPLKVTVLNDKSDLQVRFDLFERLNTGGIRLTDHEVRECVYIGKFTEKLRELAEEKNFNTVVKLPKNKQEDATKQEFILRFFAFLDKYNEFDHSVKEFLNDYCKEEMDGLNLYEQESIFKSTFEFLAEVFPQGLKKQRGTTPVNLFEGVAVGAALAIKKEGVKLSREINPQWVRDETMTNYSTGGTNSRNRVIGRIEYSRDNFIEAQ